MATGEVVALDTNVLVYADDPASPFHPVARRILEEGLLGQRRLCVSPQILAEYFSVITSPKHGPNPLSPEEGAARAGRLARSRRIGRVHPKRGTIARCLASCAARGLRGPRIFDALYAMTLLDNGVRTLLTANVRDFTGIPDLKVVNPFVQ
jgi:predicted nucleic acid-binding protein